MADPTPNPTTRLQHDRKQEIYLLALRDGSVEVAELAERFGVTTETIRRDLSDLQANGRLRRVHGGAVPLERVHHEPMVTARDRQQAAEKVRIAEAAVEDVPLSGTVIIDSGSTLERLAAVFPVDRDLHVVTNSLRSALTLARRGVERLTVLGGGVNTNTFAMVDAFTLDTVRELSVDVLFVSCDGLSFRRGLTTPYRVESMVKRAMIDAASRVVALADHSKLGNDQLFAYAGLDELDVLVTDTGASPGDVERLRCHELELRVV